MMKDFLNLLDDIIESGQTDIARKKAVTKVYELMIKALKTNELNKWVKNDTGNARLVFSEVPGTGGNGFLAANILFKDEQRNHNEILIEFESVEAASFGASLNFDSSRFRRHIISIDVPVYRSIREMLKFFKSNKARIVGNLVHELTHLFDFAGNQKRLMNNFAKRTDATHTKPSMRGEPISYKGFKFYANDPREFNAYFFDVLDKVDRVLVNSKAAQSDNKKFMRLALNQVRKIIPHIYTALSKKYKRKFVKRLYQYWVARTDNGQGIVGD